MSNAHSGHASAVSRFLGTRGFRTVNRYQREGISVRSDITGVNVLVDIDADGQQRRLFDDVLSALIDGGYQAVPNSDRTRVDITFPRPSDVTDAASASNKLAAEPHRIRRGDRFEHPTYIIGSPKAGTARPDICTITRVTRKTIYFRTETGMLIFAEPLWMQNHITTWLPKNGAVNSTTEGDTDMTENSTPDRHTFVVVNSRRDGLRVHAPGCADIALDKRNSNGSWRETGMTKTDVAASIYSDQIDEGSMTVNDAAMDVTFLPCTEDLFREQPRAPKTRRPRRARQVTPAQTSATPQHDCPECRVVAMNAATENWRDSDEWGCGNYPLNVFEFQEITKWAESYLDNGTTAGCGKH